MNRDLANLKNELSSRIGKPLHVCVTLKDFLLREPEDYLILIYELDNGANLFNAVMRLRRHKIEQRDFNRIIFAEEFANNARDSLEELFMHPLHNDDIALCIQLIDTNKIELEDIYDTVYQNPGLHPFRILSKLRYR